MTTSTVGWDPKKVKFQLNWLKANSQFDEMPASITEFLGPGYCNIFSKMRPGVTSELVTIFGEEVNPERIANFRYGMFTGAIGIGKTTMASIVIPYMCHWILCLKDPQDFYDLLPGTKIAFMQMSTTADQAVQTVFGDIKSRIDYNPWFTGKYPYDNKFTKQIRFAQKDIWILPGNSKETTFEGYNILGGILDEADSHKVTTEKDYGEEGFNTIDNRIDSRFEDRGFLLVVGQMKRAAGFAAKKYRELKTDPNAHTVRMTIWESFGWQKYLKPDGSRDSFYYDIKRKELLPPVAERVVSDNIIEIPNVYKKAFQNNPEKALRDLAGIPPSAGDPFISLTYKLDEAVERWQERHDHLGSPVDKSVTRPKFADWFMCKTSLKRAIHIDMAYCVDDQTEIFTQRGWLRYDQVQIGDKTLAIDKVTHQARWEDIKAVNIFDAKPREMLSIEGKSHSSLSTMSHRWYVNKRDWDNSIRSYSGRSSDVVLSSQLNEKHSIVRSAPVVNLPLEPKYSDALVELVAWFWTEGNIVKLRDGSLSDNVMIYQSSKVNDWNCNAIYSALETLFGEPVDAFPRLGRFKPTAPMWRYYQNGDKICFYLNSVAGRVLLDHAPGRIVTAEFITSLTKSQLLLFVETSYLADRNNDSMMSQKDKRSLESLQMALVLLGYATNAGSSSNGMYYVSRLVDREFKLRKRLMERVIHTGIVWCPTTESGSWLARRNGSTFYTGNSADGDALGLAMGHVSHVITVDGDKKPYIVFDFLMRIHASPGTEILIQDVRRMIYELKDHYRFKIRMVTADGFQSTDTMQQLRKRRFATDYVSVDKSMLPYEDLREAIYEDRIEFPPYITKIRQGDVEEVEIAIKELLELEQGDKKVDHTEGGSKDVADAMAGVVFTLMGDRSFRRNVISIDNARIRKQLEESMLADGTTGGEFRGLSPNMDDWRAPIPPSGPNPHDFLDSAPTRLIPKGR